MLAAHMADDAKYLKALEKLRRESADAMFNLPLGDSFGHARLKGIREGLDKAEAAFKQAAKQDDEDMHT